MNPLYNHIIDIMRGARSSVLTSTGRLYTFGSICHGEYLNWKHDPKPTVLIMWSDVRYTHGLNIHYLSTDEQRSFLRYIYIVGRAQQIVNPRLLYLNFKNQFPSVIKKCYRLYHTKFCNYKTISPGLAQIPLNICYPISDGRDGLVQALNNGINPATIISENIERKIAYNQNELQKHIIESLNSKPLFLKS